MKVIDIINDAVESGRTRFAFELLPPLKGETIGTIYETIDNLIRFDPAYINITYHREDIKYIERADGLLERRIVRKRPGTISIAAAIKAKYGVEVVPHLICGGLSRFEIEAALIEMDFLGIENVLALRGDSLKGENKFIAHPEGYSYACDLIGHITEMNKGNYIDCEIENCHPTDFCIGVAGYPEKHMQAPNISTDIQYLKNKVDAGAEYIVTQMFFDNSKFFTFVEECRKAGINVPIIPGIKPFSTKTQLTMLPHIFHVDLPDELVSEVSACKNNQEVRKVGVEWAVAQGRELIKSGVPALHFYTMGKSDNMIRIAEQLF
ncbi:MAG: methylenetetrahydrofolate reductase [NAD(P)H] [Rikenellaceae bacterium]|nr:methylenetetrahydrofolate reductase [NAD(P)H] [Rikenellaceae bacterium]